MTRVHVLAVQDVVSLTMGRQLVGKSISLSVKYECLLILVVIHSSINIYESLFCSMYFPGTEDKVVNNQDGKSSFFTELIMRDMSYKQINKYKAE